MSGVLLTGTRMESLSLLASLPGPVQDIIRPLVEPLLERWDALVGDDDAVHESAARWRGLAAHLDDLARQQVRTVEDSEVAWLGLAQRSFADAASEVAVELDELSRRAVDVSSCLDEAAVAVRETERLVRELIRELLEWAALSLAVSAATSLVTLGASAIAGATAAAAKAAVTGSRIASLVRQLALVLRRIKERVDAYRRWVAGRSRVTRLALGKAESKAKTTIATQVTGLDGNYKDPALGLVGTAVGLGPRVPIPRS